MCLLTLPSDVQSLIWRMLGLEEIARLRQTCASLAAAISVDKQLWIHIFNTDVKAKSLRIPPSLRQIDEVDAHDIESWVKHAILLDRGYNTPDKQLFTRELGVTRGLRITWLKLFFGCWCLVAAANNDESELTLWKINPDGAVTCSAKAFLDAPIIDGQIECSTSEVRCAITVATSHPYILVFGTYQSASTTVFRKLARLPDASHVQFFRDDLVGFAVRSGDDTYPHLANWRTG